MKRARRVAIVIAVTLAAAYLLLLTALFFGQRALLFPRPLTARESGSSMQKLTVQGLPALYSPAAPGKPTLVFFHGNASQLADATWWNAMVEPAGIGVFSIEYPGYAGAPGEPSEASLFAGSEQGLLYLEKQLGVPRAQQVLLGQSLGTGVAVKLASLGFGRKVVLLSPFTSIADVAAREFPIVPQALVRDRFDSAALAPSVQQPVLIFHGTQDEVVPFELGQKLSMLLPHCEFVAREGVHHNDIADRADVLKRIIDFALAGS